MIRREFITLLGAATRGARAQQLIPMVVILPMLRMYWPNESDPSSIRASIHDGASTQEDYFSEQDKATADNSLQK